MPDVFISYSSKDRGIAERVHDALSEAGYSVFWDQEIPAGKDWDSWIREQLIDSRLAIVLWSKASIASPNVRHEAIIARDGAGLLPLMIDELAPSDFPMGLFLVQAMKVGRSEREFDAAKAKILTEVRNRIGTPATGAAMPAGRRKARRRRRFGFAAAAVALLIALALVLAWPSLKFRIDPNAPPVTVAELDSAVAGESVARERVARNAETALSGDTEAIGTNWAWFAGQLISAAPGESRPFVQNYFRYLDETERDDCGCFIIEGVPNSIGNGWVIITAAQYRRPAPRELMDTILDAQHPEGWWTISLNGVRQPTNAATHATAMLTIALAEARRAGIVIPRQRPRVDAALRRATNWLNRGPDAGSAWSDYPNDERRAENLVFAAMATVATALAGETRQSHAARAFLASVETLPPPIEHFPSGAYVELDNGERYIDNYRHPVSAWVGAASAFAWRAAAPGDRRKVQRVLRDWLAVNLSDEALLRQDWITGETLFLRRLAFRELRAIAARE